MMKRLIVRVAALALIGGLSGCSALFGPEGFFRDRGDDYLKADVLEPIQLPEGVRQTSIQQLYVIPPIEQQAVDASDEFTVPRPQALGDSAFTDRVKIQKLGDKRWILVSAPPAEIWPLVRNFLSRNNLEVVYTDAANGVIETGWLRFKDDEDSKDKYRLQIEQGVQPDSTEVHVLHMSVRNDIPGRGQVNWPEESIDKEREAWMMDELAATMASDVGTSQAASLQAQTIGLRDKVVLDSDDGEPVLRLSLPQERAWATVAHAVSRGGFTLWESDEPSGIFYVNFDPAALEEEGDAGPGFFRRLLGLGRDSEEAASSPYTLEQILAHLPASDSAGERKIFSSVQPRSGAEPLKQVPGYLVVVRGESGNIEVRIRDGYARTLDLRDARQLLTALRQNLI